MKNKLSVPKRKVRFTVKYGVGINTVLTLLDALEMRGAVSKEGAYYTYKEQRLMRKDFPAFISGNKDLKKELLERLKG